MKTIISMMEDNIFSGILVKKGLNNLSDKKYKVLTSNRHFQAAYAKGFIRQIISVSAKTEKPTGAVNPDFNTMPYAELKKYVKENDIKAASQSKADILAAIENYKKGE